MGKGIVIVGGGFGGVYAAKRLLRADVRVTLVHPKEYLLYTPMLHEVATGGLSTACVTECIAEALAAKHFTHLRETARGVNFHEQIVRTGKRELRYDYLLIAIGARPNFFGAKGREHALPLKTLGDAKRIRHAILASAGAQTYVVVGGGPTGVEIMGELVQYVRQLRVQPTRFILIHAGDRLVPQAHPENIPKITQRLRRMGVEIRYRATVREIRQKSVCLSTGEEIPAAVVIWAGGVQPNALSTKPAVVNAKGRFPVDPCLRIAGVRNAYAIGDCAAVTDAEGKVVPDLAQSAVREGKAVAENILAAIAGEPQQPFTFHQRGFLVSVGEGYGVAEIGAVRFSGFWAWWLMRTIYLMKMLGTARKFKVAFEWTIRLFSKRDTTEVRV